MMQVVAVLNPIAGEKMQEELEERISALQGELERAHSEVGTIIPARVLPITLGVMLIWT